MAELNLFHETEPRDDVPRNLIVTPIIFYRTQQALELQ